jgi:hypothetical protein
MTRYTRIIAGAVLLFSLAAGAQEPAAQATTPSPSEPAKTSAATEAATAGEPAPAAADDTSPSDYRASEKISEDLSVSFPVDI